MSKDLENYDQYVPEDIVKEIDDYERRFKVSKPREKGRYPSNEDIVNAILRVTSGKLTRYNVENLYNDVVEFLKREGFNTIAVTPSRIERLVSSLIRKGVMSSELK
ncbi:MAG: hypothetical protein QW775_02255 [Ignisphaera sp.]|uniref:Uncharacterized protein n=1 Tax=Ignisphaera aggregans TaxID=334771 RepID=A0A7C4NK51_9CREN